MRISYKLCEEKCRRQDSAKDVAQGDKQDFSKGAMQGASG